MNKLIPMIGLCVMANSAVANQQLRPGYSECTNAYNCGGSASVKRAYEPDLGVRYTAQVYALQGECLRIEVTKENKDLDMAVIGPHQVDPVDGSGRIWADDQDGEAFGTSTPRVVIDPVPDTGYYTVTIGGWTDGNDKAKFDFVATRYNTGNTQNCVNPNLSWGQTYSGPLPLAPGEREGK